MELSLLSREVIAMSAAVGLSHNMFDGALFLGVCDKIVPGLAMAAFSFGHLPAVFIPSGPMASGLANKEKVRIRQLYAEGKVDRMALLESKRPLTTRRVRALSTVRPIPTRWSLNSWACNCQVLPSCIRMHRCVKR
jgi:dihydroxyacid dehydratase/phosphogluconate dehydratase